jgi:hypothetical protein
VVVVFQPLEPRSGSVRGCWGPGEGGPGLSGTNVTILLLLLCRLDTYAWGLLSCVQCALQCLMHASALMLLTCVFDAGTTT